MLSPENIPANPSTTDDNQSSGSRKTSSLRPPEQPQKCPRCDSPNTKFCYYNNYSLAQPRHFCKTCRRYWTKGGALRNVPIGGGCRKNKRTKSASRLSGDSKDTAATSDAGGLKFFHGLSPTMDFQFGGRLPFSRPLFSSASGGYNNHFVSFGDLSSAAATATNPPRFHIDDGAASSGSSMGFQFHYPVPPGLRQGESGDLKFQEMYSMNVHSSLASSIESLSYVNQDLHWKLQQQRLAMLLGGENQKDGGGVSSHPSTLLQNQTQKSQPISFQNLEIPNLDVSDASNPTKSGLSGTTTTTEWLFENSYNPAGTTTNINSSSNGNGTSNWNGIQAWTDLHQYSALP